MFADDTCIYATEKHERRVLCKLQRGLTAMNSWCERCNIKINEGKTRAIYFSRWFRVPDGLLQLNVQDIPFVYNVTILVSLSTGGWHGNLVERNVAKALGTYVRTYFLFKSRHLSTNINLTLYRTLISSVTTYASPTWDHAVDADLLKLQSL
jgi:hypothetical protein